MKDYENELTQEEYQQIIEESLKKSRDKRFGVTITINDRVYRLKKRAVALGLAASFIAGGLTVGGIDKIIDNAEENSYSGKYAIEFQKEVINDRDLKQFTMYKGLLDTSNIKRADNDFFFKEIDKKAYRKKRIYIFKELLYRLIFKRCSPNYDYKKAKFDETS